MLVRCMVLMTLVVSLFSIVSRADETAALPVEVEPVFTEVEWTGWQPIDDAGLNFPFRFVGLTHANDKTNRLFVLEQHGTIHTIENQQAPQKSRVFLDIRDQVRYADNENEEGFLGLAFHPRFAENGEFFVYYTADVMPRESVISRFRVSRDDPDKADPESEEVLMRIAQPFWNHNGGTIAFGPDGYLYVGLGDGGAGGDPKRTAQDLSSTLGKILRIDVDRRGGKLPYAIPPDNPFVEVKNAQPEIYAYGLRNVWRLAFDPQTKRLWCGDVGQDKWEEINLIEKGGNYGWSVREGNHPFYPEEAVPGEKYIDPIFEYHHDVGKSITGGLVYRGKQVPDLVGKYLFADYVSGKIWALDYDPESPSKPTNYRIPSPLLPITSFGEDADGEAYVTIVAQDGKGLFRFRPKTEEK